MDMSKLVSLVECLWKMLGLEEQVVVLTLQRRTRCSLMMTRDRYHSTRRNPLLSINSINRQHGENLMMSMILCSLKLQDGLEELPCLPTLSASQAILSLPLFHPILFNLSSNQAE